MREIKIRAAREDRKLKELIPELLEKGLAAPDDPPDEAPFRVQFPLIRTAHPAAPGQELTPERIAEILSDQEVERYGR